MQGFLWVNFFKKQQKLFVTQPSQLWMDGLTFSARKDSENQRSPRYCSPVAVLTEARICLYNLCMHGHAPLRMGIYNNYSGYYKVRRRLYANERYVKLTLSGKTFSKMSLTK